MIGALIGGAIGGFIGGAIGSSGGDSGPHYHYHAPPQVNHKLLAHEIVNAIVEKNNELEAKAIREAQRLEFETKTTCYLCRSEIKIDEIGFAIKMKGYDFYCSLKCGCHQEYIEKNFRDIFDPLVSCQIHNCANYSDQRSALDAMKGILWEDYLYNGGKKYEFFSKAFKKFYTVWDDDEHYKRPHPLDRCRKRFENQPAICLTIESGAKQLT